MISYELQVTSYELRVTSYELRVTSYKLHVTSSKLRVTSYKLRVARLHRQLADSAGGASCMLTNSVFNNVVDDILKMSLYTPVVKRIYL